MDNLTRQLAAYVTSRRFDDIPADIVRSATRHLVDAIGCALGGRDCEAARIGRQLACGTAPNRHAGRILGQRRHVPASEAAFTNTAMIRYLDFNDSWQGGHPSDLLGGLLAIAESAGADGRRLITAMIVAYEVVIRLIRATSLRERGWDQGFVIGVGTTCGAGHLLRLDAEQMTNAIAIITVANVPLRATRAGQLSSWKGAATAFAVRNGVYAALLAAGGMTGPEAAFEGRHGLMKQITGPFELETFPDAGGDYLLPVIVLKYWPVEGHAQAAVWAALRLREEMAPADIARIEIFTHWSAWHEAGSEPAKWNPTTRETADHSFPYIFARTLVDGTITVSTFDAANYLDPTLRPLMAKISVHQDAEIDALYPATWVMRVEATAADGEREIIRIINPRGHGMNPMSDDEVDNKFTALAEPALGTDRTRAALGAWRSIAGATTISAALDLLLPGG